MYNNILETPELNLTAEQIQMCEQLTSDHETTSTQDYCIATRYLIDRFSDVIESLAPNSGNCLCSYNEFNLCTFCNNYHIRTEADNDHQIESHNSWRLPHNLETLYSYFCFNLCDEWTPELTIPFQSINFSETLSLTPDCYDVKHFHIHRHSWYTIGYSIFKTLFAYILDDPLIINKTQITYEDFVRTILRSPKLEDAIFSYSPQLECSALIGINIKAFLASSTYTLVLPFPYSKETFDNWFIKPVEIVHYTPENRLAFTKIIDIEEDEYDLNVQILATIRRLERKMNKLSAKIKDIQKQQQIIKDLIITHINNPLIAQTEREKRLIWDVTGLNKEQISIIKIFIKKNLKDFSIELSSDQSVCDKNKINRMIGDSSIEKVLRWNITGLSINQKLLVENFVDRYRFRGILFYNSSNEYMHKQNLKNRSLLRKQERILKNDYFDTLVMNSFDDDSSTLIAQSGSEFYNSDLSREIISYDHTNLTRSDFLKLGKLYDRRRGMNISGTVPTYYKSIYDVFGYKYIFIDLYYLHKSKFNNMTKDDYYYAIYLYFQQNFVNDVHFNDNEIRIAFIAEYLNLYINNNQPLNAQMFSVNPVTHIRNIANRTTDFLNKIDDLPDKVNALLAKIGNFVDESYSNLVNLVSDWECIKKWLIFLVIVFLLLTLPRIYSDLLLLALGVLFMAVSCNNKHATDLMTYIKNYLTPVRSYSLSGEEPLIAQTSGDVLTKVFFMGSSLWLIGKIPSEKTIDKFISRLDSVPRAIQGAEKIWNYISSLIPTLENFFYKTVLKDDTYIPTLSQFKPVDEWISRVNHYTQLDVQKISTAKLCDVIEMSRLYPIGLDLQSRCSKEQWGRDVQYLIGRTLVIAKELQTLAQNTGMISASEMRDQPTSILLGGFPGVGKSYVTKFLATYIMSKLGYKPEDIIPNIYTVITDNEFWDSYNHQFCIQFDDFGQKVDTTTNPNLDYFEFLRCANTATYPLTKAELVNKGNVYFDSPLIILSTNLLALKNHIKSISDLQAVKRRIDYSYFVTIKREYRINTDESIDPFALVNQEKCRLNVDHPDLQPNKPNLFIWEFYRYDPMEGLSSLNRSEAYSYEQVAEDLFRSFNKNNAKSTAFNNTIKQYVKDVALVAQVGNEVVVPSDIGEILIENVSEEQYPQTTAFARLTNFFSGPLKLCSTLLSIYQAEYIKAHGYLDESKPHICKAALAKMAYQLIDIRASYNSVHSYYLSLKERITQFYNDFTSKHTIIATIVKYGTLIISGIALAFTVKNLFFNDESEDVKFTSQTSEVPSENFNHVPDMYKHLCSKTACHFTYNSGKTVPFFKSKYTCIYCSDRRYVFLDEFPRCLKCFNKFETLMRDENGEVQEYNNGISNYELPEFAICQLSKPKIYTPTLKSQNNEKAAPVSRANIEVISSNLFHVKFQINGEYWQNINNCLFIKGHIGIINRHCLFYFKNRNVTKVMFQSRNLQQGFEIFPEEFEWIDVVDEEGRTKDLAFFSIPNDSIRFRDITKHFITNEELKKIPNVNSDMTGYLITLTPDKSSSLSLGISNISRQESRIIRSASNLFDEHTVYGNVRYQCNSMEGDCGSPVIVNNVYIPSSIFGIHIAGDGKTVGLSTVVTQEIISNQLKRFDKLQHVTWDEQELEVLEAENYRELHSMEFLPPGDFYPLLKTDHKLGQSPVNRLKPSLFFDQIEIDGVIQKHTKIPSMLGFTRDDEDNKVDLLTKGLSKMGTKPFRIPQLAIDRAVQSYENKTAHNNPEWGERRLLTPEEAITGVLGAQYDNPVNRKSSCGYPRNKPGNRFHGKKEIFGTDEYTFDTPEAKKIFSDLKVNLKRYEDLSSLPLFIFTDTLKEEKLPIQKILDGKTRNFAAGNIDYFIPFRMLFGSYLNSMKFNRIRSESCVGMNVYSTDVDLLVDELLSKGNDLLAGDFSRFDATVNSQILYAVVEMINRWYDDEYSQMRLALAFEIINSVHISRNCVYMWTHSQPSGQPATAEFNCLYTSIAMRIVIDLISPKLIDFNTNFNFKTYGDDTILSFDSKKHGDWLNYKAVSEGFARIGMEYTEETKQSTSDVKWKSLDSITFLKRHIVYNSELGKYTMPAIWSNMLETLNWVPKSSNEKGQLVENCKTVLMECSLHGEEKYNRLAKEIRRLCTKYQLQIDIPHYHVQFMNMLHNTVLYGLWGKEDFEHNSFIR